MLNRFSLVVFFFFAASIHAATFDNRVWTTDGPVYSADMNGSTAYIGGAFQYLFPETGPAIALSGANLDTRFPRFNAKIKTVISDGNGGWYVGGNFTQVGANTAAQYLVHLDQNFAIDSSFSSSIRLNGPVNDIQLRTIPINNTTNANVLLVAGSFTRINNTQGLAYFAGINVDNNTVFTNISPNINGEVTAIANDNNATYLAGNFTNVNGQSRNRLASIDYTGTLTAWNPGQFLLQIIAMNDIEIVSGDVIVGGFFQIFDNTGPATINTWGLGAFPAYDPSITDPNFVYQPFNWQPNPTKNITTHGTVFSITPSLISGRFVITGDFDTIAGSARNYVAGFRNTVTGINLLAWNVATDQPVRDVTEIVDFSRNSNLFLAGDFTTVNGISRKHLAQVVINTSTNQVTVQAWDPGSGDPADSIAYVNNTFIISGDFQYAGGVRRNNAAAIDLNPASNNYGKPLAWDPDITANNTARVDTIQYTSSGVFLGGLFDFVGNSTRSNLASVDAVSGAVSNWYPKPDNWVRDIKFHANTNNIYITGHFNNFLNATGANVPHNGIARYPLSPLVDLPANWDPLAGQDVRAVVDLEFIDINNAAIGGLFSLSDANGIRNGIASINLLNGQLNNWRYDMTTTSTLGVYVYDIEKNPADNALYISGNFNSVNNQSYQFAKIDSSTSNNVLWGLDQIQICGPNTCSSGAVHSISSGKSGGSVYFGGFFNRIGTTDKPYGASAQPHTPALPDWDTSDIPNVSTIQFTQRFDGIDSDSIILVGQSTSATATKAGFYVYHFNRPNTTTTPAEGILNNPTDIQLTCFPEIPLQTCSTWYTTNNTTPIPGSSLQYAAPITIDTLGTNDIHTLWYASCDGEGHCEVPKSATFQFQDIQDPVATAFDITLTASANPNVFFFANASDNFVIAGYAVGPDGTDPLSSQNQQTSLTTPVKDLVLNNGQMTLPTGDGQKTIYFWARDAAGRYSTPLNDTILLDTQINASITLNGSGNLAGYSDSTGITVNMQSTDVSGIIAYYISNNGTPPTDNQYTSLPAPQQDFNLSVNHNLASGDGLKTVHVWLKDAATGVRDFSQTITLDTGAPSISNLSFNDANVKLVGGNYYTQNTSVTLSLNANDAIAPIKAYYYGENGAAHNAVGNTTVDVSNANSNNLNVTDLSVSFGDPTAGSKTIYVWVEDALGHISNRGSLSVTLDNTLDNANLLINGNATVETTNQINVQLDLSAGDSSGIVGYYISNSIPASIPFISVTSQTSFSHTVASHTLDQPSVAGEKTVYAWVVDAAGNQQQISARVNLVLAPGTPNFTVDTPSIVNFPEPTWRWTSTTGIANPVFKIRLNGGPEQQLPPNTFSYTLTNNDPNNLLEGIFTLTVWEVDSNGNPFSALDWPITVDLTAPGNVALTPTSPADGSVIRDTDNISFAGSTEAGSRVDLFMDGNLLQQVTADNNGAWQVNTGPVTEGTHQFTFQATDPAQNTGPLSSPIGIVFNLTNDIPVATTPATPALAQEGIPLTGNMQASDADGDALTYNVVSDVTQGDLQWNDDGSFTYTAASGSQGTDSFTFRAIDGFDGSLSNEATISFDINARPSAPQLISPNDGATSVSLTQAKFTWEKSTDPDGDAISYELHVCEFNDFRCTPYTVAWWQSDERLMVAGFGGSSVLLALYAMGLVRRRYWLVLAMALALSACGGGNNGADNTPPPDTSNQISQTIAGLSSNTIYHWKVIAIDDRGGRNESEVRSFTTSN